MDRNVPVVVDLKKNPSFSRTVPLEFPADAIPGSERARVDVIGLVVSSKQFLQATSWAPF